MFDGLTKKQAGFVQDYLETGNATQAAENHYDVANRDTARVIGSENLTKPAIQSAIQEALNEDVLAEKHLKLLNQKRVEYFIFPKKMSDEEIKDKVSSAGFEVIVLRDGEKGKYAFYSIDDAMAISKALDMGYKIKGTYAPERRLNVNVEVEVSEADRLLADKLKELERDNTGETQ